MNEQAERTLVKARANLIINPQTCFFACLLLRHTFKEDLLCETAWIDGITIGYNPDFINSLTFEEGKGLLMHEVMHIALCHHTRRNNRDKDKWNVAGDYAINDILIGNRVTLPSGALCGKYQGENAEKIYSQLSDNNEKEKEGSGKTGEVRDQPGKSGKGATPEEQKKAEQEIKKALSQSAQLAKKKGTMNGGIERVIQEILHPKVNWVDELREFLEVAGGRNDYSWNRINRRYITNNIYLPSLYGNDTIESLIVAIDTSGSVSQKMMDQFGAEISDILESYNVTIKVIYCDTSVAGTEDFSTEDLPIKLTPKGGGGTRFSPVFEYVKKQELDPVALIYLTDMAGSFDIEPPNYPTLWVNTGYRENNKVPFGKVIDVKI